MHTGALGYCREFHVRVASRCESTVGAAFQVRTCAYPSARASPLLPSKCMLPYLLALPLLPDKFTPNTRHPRRHRHANHGIVLMIHLVNKRLPSAPKFPVRQPAERNPPEGIKLPGPQAPSTLTGSRGWNLPPSGWALHLNDRFISLGRCIAQMAQ